jgi:hypothetical protein
MDLDHWNKAEFSHFDLPPSWVIFAGLLRGIALPLIEDPEVHTEPLGELGVCLLAGPKIFNTFIDVRLQQKDVSELVAFYDKADRVVYMPSSGFITLTKYPRTYTHYQALWSMAVKHGVQDDNRLTVDTYIAAVPASLIELFAIQSFAGRTMCLADGRLEIIQFERAMRASFGKN